jgi:iron complex transport system ATP-binding protein
MTAALLTAQGLGVSLSGRIVLKDISLSLSPGHLVALVNNAGKPAARFGLLRRRAARRDALSSLSVRNRRGG